MSKIINRIDALMKSTQKMCTEFGFEKQYDEISTRINQYGKQPISLLVCGEFKRGKSSFINAFLGENICAEGIGITTAAISIIRYGATRRVIRSYGDIGNGEVKIKSEEIPFEKIETFSKGTIQDIGDTVMLEIEIPNEKLRSGLIIIDTPGVGSLDPRHRMLTLYALPRANVVLFVTDAGEEMMASEADFYKMYIAPLNCPKSILLNKTDAALDDEVQTLENDTKKKLNLPKNVKVLPVSAELWKEYNISHDKDLFEVSHADTVESSIEQMKDEYWQQYAMRLRDDYANMIGELSQSIETRIVELKDEGEINEKIQSLRNRMGELTQMKKDLSDSNSGKRAMILEMIKNSQERIISDFQRESILLSTEKLRNMIDSQAYSKRGEDLVVLQMNAEITKLQASLDKRIENSCCQIAEEAEQSFQLPTLVINSPTIEKSYTTSHKPFAERVLNVVQNSYSPALLGGGLGTLVAVPIIGTVLAPFVGLAVGIGGVCVAYRRAKASESKAKMMDHIQPRVTIAMNELRMYINKKYDVFSKSLFNQLSATLEKLNDEIKSIIDLLQKCAANQKQRAEQVSLLEQKKKFLCEQMIQTKSVCADPLSINHAN